MIYQKKKFQFFSIFLYFAVNAQKIITIELSSQFFFNQNLYNETNEMDIVFLYITVIAQETQKIIATKLLSKFFINSNFFDKTIGIDIYESISSKPFIINNISNENFKRFFVYIIINI